MHVADDSPLAAPMFAGRSAGGLFDNRELSTIAMVAALHFAVSFAARLAGSVVHVFLGPWAVYLDGIGGEGIPCLLMAVIVTLIPRIGTATLTILTVWLLNGIVSGSFSLAGIAMVGLSIVVHEAILALFGVTKLERRTTLPGKPTTLLVARTALAIGLANAIALYAQFFISIYFYKLMFPMWYVQRVALVTGLGYGAIGAAIGTLWGFQLRKTAP
ncbi:MAG: hypothetical protein K8U03_23990 [Planctomycetia bacterium]|nr:hypothetical protein [Planctomycetia bacterium]